MSEVSKALRSSTESHAAKIKLAADAYSDADTKLPRKAEFLLEWTLSTLLKTKADTSSASLPARFSVVKVAESCDEYRADSPLLDVNYWQLLEKLLSDKATALALNSLLTRIPTLPILTAFIQQKPTEEALVSAVARCYAHLLPLASRKANPDALFECIGACYASTTALANGNVSSAWLELMDLSLRTCDAALNAAGPAIRKRVSLTL